MASCSPLPPGICEHAAEIRARILLVCAWLGVKFDSDANDQCASCITTADSAVSAWVIPTNEELMVARHALAHVHGSSQG